MPSKSTKQAKFMSRACKKGSSRISRSVACKFARADRARSTKKK